MNDTNHYGDDEGSAGRARRRAAGEESLGRLVMNIVRKHVEKQGASDTTKKVDE